MDVHQESTSQLYSPEFADIPLTQYCSYHPRWCQHSQTVGGSVMYKGHNVCPDLNNPLYVTLCLTVEIFELKHVGCQLSCMTSQVG